MIEKLKSINKKLIDLNKNNDKELKKQLLIKKILEEKDCFLKISIEDAYLFSAPITYNTSIDSVRLDVKDRTLNEIVQSEVINLTEN